VPCQAQVAEKRLILTIEAARDPRNCNVSEIVFPATLCFYSVFVSRLSIIARNRSKMPYVSARSIMKTARNAIVAPASRLSHSSRAYLLSQAAQGFTVDQTLLHAGPGPQYPYVDRLPSGAPVTVFGRLRGRVWCDISFQGDRGWVSGQDLAIFFHSRRVRIVEVTPVFVPVVTFEVSTYWDRYYRSKPFFAQRDRFSVNININNEGKAASGRTARFSQAAVTANVGGKGTEAKTGRGSARGHLLANAKACPAGQKNCKVAGKPKRRRDRQADNGAGAMTKDKTATAGKTANVGAVTGSISTKGGKKCQPGMANCAQGISCGNMGASGAGGGSGSGGAAPAQ
jgi:uncharacterized protein YraI